MIGLVALALLIVVIVAAVVVVRGLRTNRPVEPAHVESSEPRESIVRLMDRKRGADR